MNRKSKGSIIYKYLIVVTVLYGAVFAHEAKKAGKNVLVIDKRPNITGNVYTETVEGIHVHNIIRSRGICEPIECCTLRDVVPYLGVVCMEDVCAVFVYSEFSGQRCCELH